MSLCLSLSCFVALEAKADILEPTSWARSGIRTTMTLHVRENISLRYGYFVDIAVKATLRGIRSDNKYK